MSNALSVDLRERVVRAVAEGASCRGAAARFGVSASSAAFAKLKALLRKAAERSIQGLWSAIGAALGAFTPQECANYFAAAGYDTDAA